MIIPMDHLAMGMLELLQKARSPKAKTATTSSRPGCRILQPPEVISEPDNDTPCPPRSTPNHAIQPRGAEPLRKPVSTKGTMASTEETMSPNAKGTVQLSRNLNTTLRSGIQHGAPQPLVNPRLGEDCEVSSASSKGDEYNAANTNTCYAGKRDTFERHHTKTLKAIPNHDESTISRRAEMVTMNKPISTKEKREVDPDLVHWTDGDQDEDIQVNHQPRPIRRRAPQRRIPLVFSKDVVKERATGELGWDGPVREPSPPAIRRPSPGNWRDRRVHF